MWLSEASGHTARARTSTTAGLTGPHQSSAGAGCSPARYLTSATRTAQAALAQRRHREAGGRLSFTFCSRTRFVAKINNLVLPGGLATRAPASPARSATSGLRKTVFRRSRPAASQYRWPRTIQTFTSINRQRNYDVIGATICTISILNRKTGINDAVTFQA